MQPEREYTDYEKRILQLNDDLCAAVKESVESGGAPDKVNKANSILKTWISESDKHHGVDRQSDLAGEPPEGGVAP